MFLSRISNLGYPPCPHTRLSGQARRGAAELSSVGEGFGPVIHLELIQLLHWPGQFLGCNKAHVQNDHALLQGDTTGDVAPPYRRTCSVVTRWALAGSWAVRWPPALPSTNWCCFPTVAHNVTQNCHVLSNLPEVENSNKTPNPSLDG